MADIGIDLGTTNSVVAHLQNEPKVIENKGRQTTPSVVAYNEDDNELLVGQGAKDEAAVLPTVRSWKRDIGGDKSYELGGKHYTPVDLSAMILEQLKIAAEQRLGEPIDTAVITVPAYFAGAQKEATKRAGELAGLKNLRLLAEPTAAALAYGTEDTVLVYDLGGGTFDVAIIDCFDYKMLGLDGDNYLGGDDFDKLLLAHIAKEVKTKAHVDLENSPDALQRARNDCEKAKIKLSDAESATILVQAVVSGTPVNVKVKVTRDEFEGMIMEHVDRTIEKVESAIAKAKLEDPKFSKDDIDTILLVGGSTYIPLVQRKVAEYFGKEPCKKINPDLAVGLGAAMYTASAPIEKGVHRLTVKMVPQVTAEQEIMISGRTSPCSTVEARTPQGAVEGKADDAGKFSLTVALAPNVANNINLLATSTGGEQRRRELTVRHDENCKKGSVLEHKDVRGLQQKWPRSLGIRLTGQDDHLGIVVPEQTDIPCYIANRDFSMGSRAANMPGQCPIEIYEGDLPYSVLNTQLASLMLETPASPSTLEPLEIVFQITEDHLLVVTARMVNFPDRLVTAKIKMQTCSGDKLHILDRLDHLLKDHADKIRPEERARLNKSKMGLLDLCQQFKRDPQAEKYEKIKEVGMQLKSEVARLEAQYS